jgi:hypothetical protein
MHCATAVEAQPLLVIPDAIVRLDTPSNTLPLVATAIPTVTTPIVTVIHTKFDREHTDNQRFPAETQRKENVMWTERERRKAEAGEVVQDLDDLRNKVCELKLVVEITPTDMHSWTNATLMAAAWTPIATCAFQWMFSEGESIFLAYRLEIELRGHIFSGALELRNSDDSLMAFICPSLPDSVRRNLLSSFQACFDGNQVLRVRRLNDDFKDDESDREMEEEHHGDFTLEMVADRVLASPFHCLHFSIWNRYATTVSGVLSLIAARRKLKH